MNPSRAYPTPPHSACLNAALHHPIETQSAAAASDWWGGAGWGRVRVGYECMWFDAWHVTGQDAMGRGGMACDRAGPHQLSTDFTPRTAPHRSHLTNPNSQTYAYHRPAYSHPDRIYHIVCLSHPTLIACLSHPTLIASRRISPHLATSRRISPHLTVHLPSTFRPPSRL